MNILANILFRVLVIGFIPVFWVIITALLIVCIIFAMFIILKWDERTNTYKMYLFGKEINT